MAGYEHLIGHVAFQDTVNHILLQSGVELYTDETKAIIWLSNPHRPELNQRLVFRRPPAISSFTILICAWREVQGAIDLGKDRIPDIETVFCVACGGVGWYEDGDGNQVDCAICETKGYVEVPLSDQSL